MAFFKDIFSIMMAFILVIILQMYLFCIKIYQNHYLYSIYTIITIIPFLYQKIKINPYCLVILY
jgi:hypothetical protein